MLRKWVECQKSFKIQDLWEATLNSGFDISNYHLVKACTVKDPPRSNGNIQSSESPLGMPLSKIKDGVTVWFLIEETIAAESVPSCSTKTKNAFNILMTYKNKTSIEEKQVKNKTDELFNVVSKLLGPVKFDKENKSNAEKLIKAITDALWAIDNNHQQINKAFADKQCKQLPAYFFNIYNKQYFDYKSRKRAKPRLSEETLRTNSNGIYDVLDMWNHTRFPNELFIKPCRDLAECLRSYSDYLVKCQKRMTQNRSNDTDRLSHNFQLSNIILPVSKLNVKKTFSMVDRFFDDVQNYVPIHIDNNTADFGIPTDRKMRYLWFKELQISHRYLW